MNIKRITLSLAAITAVFATGLYAGIQMQTARAEAADSARVYEMRTYVANEGKLDDLNNRFKNHTNHLFVKHGMTLIGYWTPAEGPEAKNTLVYIIAHENRDAAKANWQAFGQDPDWQKAKAESEKDGSLVANIESQYLVPTDYSPLR